jgi:hypothetical protein
VGDSIQLDGKSCTVINVLYTTKTILEDGKQAMQNTQSKSRPRWLIFLLLAIVIFTGAFLIVTALLGPQNDPDQPIVDPVTIPSKGSIGENVESIQIDQETLFPIPEFELGGSLTGLVVGFLSLAVLMVRKKRSN